MAIRLKRILPKLILENQGGFVRGTQIMDNIILVQEAIHTSCKKKEKGMVVKLDLAMLLTESSTISFLQP